MEGLGGGRRREGEEGEGREKRGGERGKKGEEGGGRREKRKGWPGKRGKKEGRGREGEKGKDETERQGMEKKREKLSLFKAGLDGIEKYPPSHDPF